MAAPTTESATDNPIPTDAHKYGDVVSKNHPILNNSPLPDNK